MNSLRLAALTLVTVLGCGAPDDSLNEQMMERANAYEYRHNDCRFMGAADTTKGVILTGSLVYNARFECGGGGGSWVVMLDSAGACVCGGGDTLPSWVEEPDE